MIIDRRYLWSASLWLFGLLLFGALFPINSLLVTDAAPFGIASHRAALSAAEVEVIQASWLTNSMQGIATLNLAIDFVFLFTFSLGGFFLCREISRSADYGFGNRICWLLAILHLVFGMSDFIETTAQFVQLVSGHGSDTLVEIIHLVRPITISTFLTSVVGVVLTMLWRRWSP